MRLPRAISRDEADAKQSSRISATLRWSFCICHSMGWIRLMILSMPIALSISVIFIHSLYSSRSRKNGETQHKNAWSSDVRLCYVLENGCLSLRLSRTDGSLPSSVISQAHRVPCFDGNGPINICWSAGNLPPLHANQAIAYLLKM